MNEKADLKLASDDGVDGKVGDDEVWDDAAEKRLVRKIDWKVSLRSVVERRTST